MGAALREIIAADPGGAAGSGGARRTAKLGSRDWNRGTQAGDGLAAAGVARDGPGRGADAEVRPGELLLGGFQPQLVHPRRLTVQGDGLGQGDRFLGQRQAVGEEIV